MLGILCLVACSPAMADQGWEGKTVVPNRVDVRLKIGRSVVDTHGRVEAFRVLKVQEPWLWLVSDSGDLKGWVKDTDVVPVDEAIELFTEALLKQPDDWGVYLLRAAAWHARGEPTLAARDLDHAGLLRSNYAPLHHLRGVLLRTANHPAQAIEQFSRAIRLDPRLAASLTQRGMAWTDVGDHERAIADFTESIRLRPDVPLSHDRRGWARYLREDFDGAIRDLDRAILLDESNAVTHIARGMARYGKKDYSGAVADADRAIGLDPRNAAAYNLRGWAITAERDFGHAIRDFDRALALDPKFARAYTNRGLALLSRKEFYRAIADFDRAIELEPGRARPHVNRGIAWCALGKYDRAVADFNRALTLDPDSSWARFNRLVAYSCADRELALDEARSLLGRMGWRDELSIHTALVGYFAAMEQGKQAEARLLLDDAEIHSDHAHWPYPLVAYLRGNLRESDLLALADGPARSTEIHSLVGRSLAVKGQAARALPHLRWVCENGSCRDAQYQVAVAELEQIESVPQVQTALKHAARDASGSR